MATYYCRVDGNDGNAGTADTSGGAWRTLDHAGGVVAAGDTVNVRGSAGNAASYPTASPDFTIGGFFTPANGSASAGWVKWLALGVMPTIAVPSLGFFSMALNWFDGLYMYASSAGFASFGMLAGNNCVINGCIFNCNNQAAQVGIKLQGGEIVNTEVYGGTTSPSASAGAYGIESSGLGLRVHGCNVRYCRDVGIIESSGEGTRVSATKVWRCAGNGFEGNSAGANGVGSELTNCTIDGNGGHGVSLTGTNNAVYYALRNNNITNQAGGSKYGISVATSSSDKRKRLWGWNNLYGNTGDYSNVTADSTDLAADPGYAAASTGNFTPSNAATRAAFPSGWIGAVQPSAAGGGGLLVHPGMSGGARG